MPDHAAVLRDHAYHRLTVARVVEETHDTRSYVLDVPPELTETFAYRAGQFCTFRARVGADDHMRCYSMSSAPETGDDFAVTVKRVPEGKVSNWFHDQVSAGTVLDVSRPAGVFCVPDGEGPIVAFCGGSGVTPVMSIARSVLATTNRPVRILYANRDRDSVIFRDAFDSLRAEHPDRLNVRHHLDSGGGFLDTEQVAGFVDGDTGAAFFICGPAPFMDLVESTLLGLGVDPARIAIERFATPPPAPRDSPGAAGATGPAGAATADGSEATAVTLILNRKRTTVTHRPGDTLLETARRAGLNAPFSCESGNCATCMAILRDGTATMRVNNALTVAEVTEGWVLTCQAVPNGPAVTVEYEAL